MAKAKKQNALAPLMQTKVAMHAIRTFDRASGIVVLVVWGAAIILMGLSYLSVNQTLHARQQISQAQSEQPMLPQIKEEPVDSATLEMLKDKLTKRFGTKVVVTNVGGEVRIAGATPDSYQAFLSAISYLDTVTPDVSWKIKGFCVGSECPEGLMAVHLGGAKVSFTAPVSEDS